MDRGGSRAIETGAARPRVPKRARAASALCAMALAVGCATESREPASPTLLADLGAQTYRTYCASCHGPGGEGDGPVASSLRARPADLTRIAERRGGEFPDADIALVIDGRFTVDAHGTREMPIWGRRFGVPPARGGLGMDDEERVAALIEVGYAEEVARGRIASLVEYLRTIQK